MENRAGVAAGGQQDGMQAGVSDEKTRQKLPRTLARPSRVRIVPQSPGHSPVLDEARFVAFSQNIGRLRSDCVHTQQAQCGQEPRYAADPKQSVSRIQGYLAGSSPKRSRTSAMVF